MDAERIMERVRRLLAIANDPAASDNEQRIALEQAQRLMDRHAIEEWQLGSASSFIDTGRAKDLARGMLDAARKAINRPATSQIQRTSMGLSGHMEYRHTMK